MPTIDAADHADGDRAGAVCARYRGSSPVRVVAACGGPGRSATPSPRRRSAARRRAWSGCSCCADLALPIMCSRYAPRKAIGTEPITIQPTSWRLTVPLRRCTAAPTGRITTAATRSLEIAEEGLIAEQQDQHRRHQRAAAGAGHADEEAHDGAAEDDVWIDVHWSPPCLRPVPLRLRGPAVYTLIAARNRNCEHSAATRRAGPPDAARPRGPRAQPLPCLLARGGVGVYDGRSWRALRELERGYGISTFVRVGGSNMSVWW